MMPRFILPTHLLVLFFAAAVGSVATARCADEEQIERSIASQSPAGPDAQAFRQQLLGMVREAVHRSDAYGASKLLAEAAAIDVDEARSGDKLQVSLSGTVGMAGNTFRGVSDDSGLQMRAALDATAPLFDNGRVEYLTQWRSHLAQAAHYGQIGTREQIGLQTVSLMLERGRYNMQARVFRQYAHKMTCLVSALEEIASVDKGRASELVQARTTQEQAELSYAQSLATLRQVESRLRRFVGDKLPSVQAHPTAVLALPSVRDATADAERANEIAQLQAQAKAMTSQSNALAAGRKSQLNWVVNGANTVGAARAGNWGVGIRFNVPLLDPGADPAIRASQKRAQATQRQHDEALHSRKYRVLEVHDQATSAFDRAKNVVEVLRDSERVRNFTLQQWQQLGRRSLFDVMSAEGEHYALRAAYVNAIFDGQQSVALLWSLGRGVSSWLQ